MFDIDKMYGFYYNYTKKYSSANINQLLLSLTETELEYLSKIDPSKTEGELIREILSSEPVETTIDGEIVVDEKTVMKRKLRKRMKQLGKELKLKPRLVMPYGNTKKGNHNKMMDIMQMIMKQKDTAGEILKTSDFSVLQDIRERLAKAAKPMNPFDALTHIKVSNRMLVGKQLISPLANINSIIALLQQGNIKLNTPLKFNGQQKSDLSKVSSENPMIWNLDNLYAHPDDKFSVIGEKYRLGEFDEKTARNILKVSGFKPGAAGKYVIGGDFKPDMLIETKPSDTIGNWVAAIVDNGKDPLAGDLNINWATIDTLILMLSAGLDHETSLRFLNEPIIKQYAEYYLNNGGNIQAEKKANEKFFGTADPQITDLQSKQSQYIVGGDNKNILANFLLYKRMGQQLGTLVTALKVAEGGLGSSAGHTTSKLRQIQSGIELSTKESSFISGAKELIEDDRFVHNKLYKVLVEANNVISDTLGIGNYAQGTYREVLDIFTDKKKDITNLNLTAKEIDDITHHLRSYMLTGSFPFDQNLVDGFYKDFISFINKNSDYAELKEVMILDKDSGMVKYKGSQTDLGHSVEKYRDLIKSMVYDSKPEVQEFVKKLGIYSFYADGFGVSPFGYSHMLPVVWFKKFLPHGQSKQLSDKTLSKSEIDSFVEQYIRNNYQSLSFIPNAFGMATNKMKEIPTTSGYYQDDGKLFEYDHNTGEISKDLTLGQYEKGGIFKIAGKMYDAYKFGDSNFKMSDKQARAGIEAAFTEGKVNKQQAIDAYGIIKKDYSKSIEQAIEEAKNKDVDLDDKTPKCNKQ